MRIRHSRLLFLSLFLIAGGMPAPVESQPTASTAGTETTGPRWSEAAYGISLSPPPQASQWEGPRVLWATEDGYSVSFEVIFSEVPFDLGRATAATLVQLGFARSLPRLEADDQGRPITPQPRRIGERPGVTMYFNIEEEEQDDWYYGLAIFKLEPQAAAVLSLKSPQGVADEAREAFDRVIASVDVPLASELDERRGTQVEAGQAWLETINPEQVRAAQSENALYRMIYQGQDVGYLRVQSTGDSEALRSRGYEPPGTLLVQRQRQVLDGQTVDTEFEAFASDDGQREVWSHRSTVRPAAERKPGLPNRIDDLKTRPRTWTQTGIRGDQQVTAGRGPRQRAADVNAVTVITESPPPDETVEQIESHEQFLGKSRGKGVMGTTGVSEWQAPVKAYLPQVMLPVFAQLLPNEEAVYSFTAYHMPSGAPGLRTVEVMPKADGGKYVRDRPTPRVSPELYEFDADGNLVQHLFPNGLVIRPTTAEELAKIWKDE